MEKLKKRSVFEKKAQTLLLDRTFGRRFHPDLVIWKGQITLPIPRGSLSS
jgi:hypothetical protein